MTCLLLQKLKQALAPTSLVGSSPASDNEHPDPGRERSGTRQSEDRSSVGLGDIVPDFSAETTDGPIRFHEWIGQNWCVLFSHPKDFTPVCTTEMGAMVRLVPQFAWRGVKVIGLSADSLESHRMWARDIEELQGRAVNFPLIADPTLRLAKLFGMLPADVSGAEPRTATDNHTVRSVFVIRPDKRIALTISYPMSTGRNFDEILRVVDSLILSARYKVATPANWNEGDDVIILPSLSDEAAEQAFPDGWTAQKPYLRLVSQPVSPSLKLQP